MSVESLILKATDAALTADNWQYILDVTDKISSAPEEHTKPAIKVVATRLALNDANVILRTLSLLVAMAENCGSRMKQEIATKSFLQDSLIKRLANKKLHKTVKAAIVQVIEQLYETFKKDPSLKPMTDAYNQAMAEYPQYSSKRQRQHSAPDKPGKKEISETDKQKEEEELQRVLKLSLSEFEKQQSVKTYLNTKPLPTPEQDDASLQRAKLAQQKTGEQTIATVSKVRALYDLVSYEPEELSFRKGDVITVIESVYRDWWRGSLPGGRIGIFPLNYVTPIVSQSLEEIASEVAAEDKLIHSESRKVDKLLGLLSSGASINDLNEDEITQLYNEVIPLRTSLGKFIDKYSVRKEELSELNTHFNTEVKDYNDLMEKSISQRSQGRYNHQNHSGLPYPSQQQQYQPPNTAFEYSQQRAQHTQPSQPQYNPPVSQPQYNPPVSQPQHTYQTPPQHTQPVQPLQNAQQTQPPQHTQASRTQQEWNQQRYASYPSYPEASYEQLQSQPTSSGFGNAFSPDRYGSQQHTGQQQVQSVGHDPRFSNINDFPSLNNV